MTLVPVNVTITPEAPAQAAANTAKQYMLAAGQHATAAETAQSLSEAARDLAVGAADTLAALVAALDEVLEVQTELPELLTVHAKLTELLAVYADLANIDLVAADLTVINAVHAKLTELTELHAQLSKLVDLHTDLAKLVAVHGKLTEIEGVYAKLTEITDVYAKLTEITAVYNNLSTIDAVHAKLEKVESVADNMAAVLAVDENHGNINTVAEDINLGAGSKLAIVAADIADVTAVAINITDVVAVNDNKTNIDAVAADLALGASSKIAIVAADIADVTAVADNIADVNLAASKMAEIEAAPGAATDAATARDKAEEWSDQAEDVEVETGKYSAKHHAAKSQGFAQTAANEAATFDAHMKVMYPAMSYRKRVLAIANTEIIRSGIARQVIDWFQQNEYMPVLQQLFVSGAGALLRTDGLLKFYRNAYDLSNLNNDFDGSATGTAQPRLVSGIAPGSRFAAANQYGESRKFTHTAIAVSGVYTVVRVINSELIGKTQVTYEELTTGSIIETAFTGNLYLRAIIAGRLHTNDRVRMTAFLLTIYPEIESVTIETQIWSSRNLEMTRTPLGVDIPNVTVNADWANSTVLYNNAIAAGATVREALIAAAAWSYYNNDAANGGNFGKIYNWYATKLLDLDMQSFGFGWRPFSFAQVTTLSNALGGASVSGGKMKMTGLNYWNTPNTGADNSSGLTILGGGFRSITGSFSNINTRGFYWGVDGDNAPVFILRHDQASASLFSNDAKTQGGSMRLIKTT